MVEEPSDYPASDASHSRSEATRGSSTLIMPSESTLETIYRAVSLGMAPYEAMLVAELTDEQIEYLDNDASFNRHIHFYQQKTVYDILERLDSAMKANLNIGNSTEARWLLSKMDRKRFGSGPLEVGGAEDLPPLQLTRKT